MPSVGNAAVVVGIGILQVQPDGNGVFRNGSVILPLLQVGIASVDSIAGQPNVFGANKSRIPNGRCGNRHWGGIGFS